MKTRHVDCPRSATFVLRFAILKLAISLQASYAVAYVAAVRLPTRSRGRLRASPVRPLADICVRPRYGLSSSSSLFFLSVAPASLSAARPTAIRCENYSTISPPSATHSPNTGISVRPVSRRLLVGIFFGGGLVISGLVFVVFVVFVFVIAGAGDGELRDG